MALERSRSNHFSFRAPMLIRNPLPLAVLQQLGALTGDRVSAVTVRRLLEAQLIRCDGGSLAVRTDDIPELAQP